MFTFTPRLLGQFLEIVVILVQHAGEDEAEVLMSYT